VTPRCATKTTKKRSHVFDDDDADAEEVDKDAKMLRKYEQRFEKDSVTLILIQFYQSVVEEKMFKVGFIDATDKNVLQWKVKAIEIFVAKYPQDKKPD